MDYTKEAEKPHRFEYVLFILLGISVLYLFAQLFGFTGLAITGNVVENGQEGQTANIDFVINLKDAEHYGKDYVNNIYDEIRELDEIWSEEIYDGDYVRIIFEENLTSKKDITIYPRIVSGNPIIDVYEKEGDEIIAKFDNLINGKYNKIYLTNLQGSQDTFDLRVLGGSVQF